MSTKRYTKQEQTRHTQQRVRRAYSESQNSEFFPEKKQPGMYDDDVCLRVAIYARVSTDDPRQTTSYELQKVYYDEFVKKHPNWVLVDIYADEGISGTSLKHRDAFLRMIEDCKAGKIDLIITKSVSRFARNVVDFLGTIHMLADRNPPVDVFFETENLSSLNEDTSLGLSFQATMAQEESQNRRRSMETSLRMRLDHGLPLTPELLGFMHDDEGKLIINPETAHIPKLMFYMYLFGYTSQQIADALTYLGKKTYLGNAKWTAGSVVRMLHNERYCGDVFTRKTFTTSVLTHRSVKNRGERPRTWYHDDHPRIVSYDDFIAVQRMIENAKYGNKSLLPDLHVIPEGLLKGFVIVNPRWGGFTKDNYLMASAGADSPEQQPEGASQATLSIAAGAFDMRDFKVVHGSLFHDAQRPVVTASLEGLRFNNASIQRMDSDVYVELLIHPGRKLLAVRPTTKDNRNMVIWAKAAGGKNVNKQIAGTAFMKTMYAVFGWKEAYKYKMSSAILKTDTERVLIFRADDAQILIPAGKVGEGADHGEEPGTPNTKSGKTVVGLPIQLASGFGNNYYEELSYEHLANMTRGEWKTRVDGKLVKTGMNLQVTDFDTLKSFITEQLGDWQPKEDTEDNE